MVENNTMRCRAPRNFSGAVVPVAVSPAAALYAASKQLLPELVDEVCIWPGTYLAAIPRDMIRIIASQLIVRRRVGYLQAELARPVTVPVPERRLVRYDSFRGYGAVICDYIRIPEVCADVTDATRLIFILETTLVVCERCTYIIRGDEVIRVPIGVSRSGYAYFPAYLGMGVVAWSNWCSSARLDAQMGIKCSTLDSPTCMYNIVDVHARTFSILPCGLTLCHTSSRLINPRTGCTVRLPRPAQDADLYNDLYIDDYGESFIQRKVANRRAHHLGLHPLHYNYY